MSLFKDRIFKHKHKGTSTVPHAYTMWHTAVTFTMSTGFVSCRK